MSQPGKAPVQAPKYQNDALPDGQSIRMLNLYAGALDDPLESELEVLDIASCGNYETLSYVWGEPERCHNIICNGKRIGLAASLHDALRQPDQHRLLWADQICMYSY